MTTQSMDRSVTHACGKGAYNRVSRRKKGSARRRKAVTLLATAHQQVRRQRQDFHHKTAPAIIRENDTIYHEDLQTANMVRNHHLARSISDAGGVPEHPERQGDMRRSLSRSGQSCIHQPDLLWLRWYGRQTLIR